MLCSIVIARSKQVSACYTYPKSIVIVQKAMLSLLWIVVKLKFFIALIAPPSPPCSKDLANLDFGASLDPGEPLEVVIVH